MGQIALATSWMSAFIMMESPEVGIHIQALEELGFQLAQLSLIKFE